MRSSGYSLIELLVVLAVLGVLAGLSMPIIEVVVRRQQEQELKRALWEIRDALDAYRRAAERGSIPVREGQSGYPPDLAVLARGLPDAKDPTKRLLFLRRVPRDPFADPSLPAERTWLLRSYRSDAENPTEGEDVYDVQSRSLLIGLNGIALRKW